MGQRNNDRMRQERTKNSGTAIRKRELILEEFLLTLANFWPFVNNLIWPLGQARWGSSGGKLKVFGGRVPLGTGSAPFAGPFLSKTSLWQFQETSRV